MTVLNAAKANGLADSGDFDSDLSSLLQLIGEAAKDSETAVVLFIDELQFVPEKELGSLIAALHQCAQMDLPVTLVGAGLPQLVGNVGRAKSYSERLFKFHTIDKLDDTAARLAIERPAAAEGVSFEPDALSEILLQTHNYPYFLQEWGDKCWAEAVASPVTLDDVSRATEVAIKHLDESFFAVRFDRCTPLERTYMRAMAELGDDSVRSGEVATLMNRSVQQLAPSRSSLIKKGMIYSPAHGDAAFTVPLFAQYMRRRIPGFE